MNIISRLSVMALVCTAALIPTFASERNHKIIPEDFFDIGVMGSVQLSRDGKKALWLESRWDKELDKAQKDLWVLDTQTRATTRLTFSNESESSPVFSPDGQFIYFMTKVNQPDGKAPFNGKTQVFRVATMGGDIQPITKEAQGVSAFELSERGDTLYFLGNKTVKDKDGWASLRAAQKGPNYAHGERTTNPLYKLDLAHFKQSTVVDDDSVVWQFSVNSDESKIARITTKDNEIINLEGSSKIEIFQTKTGTNTVLNDKLWREQSASAYGWLLGLDWHQDNQQLAFRIDFDGHPGRLFVVDSAHINQNTSVSELTRAAAVTLVGEDIHWRPKSNELCYRGADHGRIKLFCSDFTAATQGETRTVIAGDLVMGDYSFSDSGKQVAFSHNSLTHFHDLFIADADSKRAKFKRLTNINPQVDTWMLPQISTVSWKASDGSLVEGILELPPGYKKADGPLPLVVQIHGGPTSATPYALQHRSYGRATFAADGWALLSPNYRGSTGYGDQFLTQLVGHEHDIEVGDILAGVDSLIADGLVDGNKMAVMGWSNGGYLTNALISTTTRFKAASSGAGVFDQRLQWMLEDTPGHVINFMQGLPWQQADEYTKASSLTYADKITTPTLIHIGEKDERVPLGHAQGLYRALKHYLNVPVELLVYPGESHGLSQYQHRQAKMAWDKAWFDHYVLNKPLPKA